MTINTVLVSSHEYLLNKTKQLLEQLEQVHLTYLSKTSSSAIEEIARAQTKLVIIVDKPKDDLLSNFILRVMQAKPTPCLILLSTQDSVSSFKEYIDIPLVDTLELNKNDPFFIKLLSIRINILSKLKVERFSSQIDRIGKTLRDKTRIEQDKEDREPETDNYTLSNNTPSGSTQIVEVAAPRRKILKKTDPNEESVDEETVRKIDFSKVIVLGASTGGPRALTEVLMGFPKEFPPVLVVQHMPRGFVPNFADRLNHFCKLSVVVANDGDIITKNTVYVAPGGRHMELDKIGNNVVKIKITEGPLVNYVRPAVDVTLFAVARVYGHRAISVILTGMGNDGREGSRIIKKMGGKVIAQNEESSVVYGMNRAVVESNLADSIVDISQITPTIIKTISSSKKVDTDDQL